MAWHMWRTVAPNFDDFSKRRVYQLGRRLALAYSLSIAPLCSTSRTKGMSTKPLVAVLAGRIALGGDFEDDLVVWGLLLQASESM